MCHSRFRESLDALLASRRAATAIEYALVGALIATGVFVVMHTLGVTIAGIFTKLATFVDSGR